MSAHLKQGRKVKEHHRSKAQLQDTHAINKITPHHFSAQLQHQDDDDNTNPVTIYIRCSTKKSYKISVASKISISQIKQMAEQKMSIKKDKQILHLNGKNVTDYSFIRLQSQNIIHVTNSEDLFIDEEEIDIKVKIIDSFIGNKVQNKIYKIKSNQKISIILKEIKIQKYGQPGILYDQPYYFLLQSSRLLEKDKSFLEQNVPKNGQLICLITKHQLKTRFTNDTKEEILHDITQLLGFEEESQSSGKRLEDNKRARYPNLNIQQDQGYSVRVKEIPEPTEQQYNLYKVESSPNFMKKKQNMSKTYSCETPQRPLATKLKASKSKKQLQILLKSQEKQTSFFQTPEVIISKSPIKQTKQSQMQIHKPTPSLPKIMPAQQRKKIRLQMEKLFDFGQNQALEVKEQQKPQSPPTQQPNPPPLRQKQRMRFSMGSRPAFLDQLKLSLK